MSDDVKIAIIGLDTSHTIAFANLIQGEGKRLDGLRVVNAMRFPSAFQTEEGQDERQAQLEGWGVAMKPSVAEAVAGMDAVFLEINDPALHLEYFEQVAGLGVPVFIDKPLAGNLAEGRRIAEVAETNGTAVWSSSSLRYLTQLAAAKEAIPEPLMCNVFGALGRAAAGSDLVWYGVHATEMLVAIMGTGAKTVRAVEDGRGIVLLVDYGDERRGIVECNRGSYHYGGRVHGKNGVRFFEVGDDVLYYNLLVEIRRFLVDGVIPVPMEESLEVQAIMDAGERSLTSGKSETVST